MLGRTSRTKRRGMKRRKIEFEYRVGLKGRWSSFAGCGRSVGARVARGRCEQCREAVDRR